MARAKSKISQRKKRLENLLIILEKREQTPEIIKRIERVKLHLSGGFMAGAIGVDFDGEGNPIIHNPNFPDAVYNLTDEKEEEEGIEFTRPKRVDL